MIKAPFTYWKESDGKQLGYLNEYPDHWTQGENLEDLKEHLGDLLELFGSDRNSRLTIESLRKEIAEEAKNTRAMFLNGRLTPQSVQETIASLHKELAKDE